MGKDKTDDNKSLSKMLDELIHQLEGDISTKRKKSQSQVNDQNPKSTSQKPKEFAPVACKECFKEYKYPKRLKNHKCPAVHGLSGVLKTESSKRTQQKTVKFAENLENFIVIPFQCPQCSLKFNHRRGFLHHRKNEKCITIQEQDQSIPEPSLSSRINALYSLFC